MMETWGEIAQRIYATLEHNGLGSLVNEMEKEYGVGGTAGEMFSILCVWLAKMRNSKNVAYGLIKDDADKLLNYAVELNYFTNRELGKL